MKVIKWLDENFEGTIMLVMLILITTVMSVQIVARYVFQSPMPWPEEFSRYCYIWTVFLSLGFTLKKGNMLRVNVVVDLFPNIVRNLIYLSVNVVLLVVFAVFFYNALIRTNFVRGTGQVSPAMRIPTWLMYCSTVIGFGLGVLRLAQACLADMANLNRPAITTKEAVLQEAAEEAAVVLDERERGSR